MTEPTPLPRRLLPQAQQAQPRQQPGVQSDELEHDIGEALRHARPVVMPAPVNNDLGRMSAEAVLAQYEVAAKSVEEMGTEIKARIKNLEGALRECDETMKKLSEAAQSIRDQGKRVQVQIEEASAVSNDIRQACVEVMRKVGS